LANYPDIKVEIVVDNKSVIIDERYDAGVRLGEHVAKDMIAVSIGADVRFAVAGSPPYFANCPAPVAGDLIAHKFINLQLPTHGGLHAREFEKDGSKSWGALKANSSSTASSKCATLEHGPAAVKRICASSTSILSMTACFQARRRSKDRFATRLLGVHHSDQFMNNGS